jgi:hypothetical protein
VWELAHGCWLWVTLFDCVAYIVLRNSGNESYLADTTQNPAKLNVEVDLGGPAIGIGLEHELMIRGGFDMDCWRSHGWVAGHMRF